MAKLWRWGFGVFEKADGAGEIEDVVLLVGPGGGGVRSGAESVGGVAGPVVGEEPFYVGEGGGVAGLEGGEFCVAGFWVVGEAVAGLGYE